MTDINQLINDLESMVDSGSERVADLFRQLRESVPRPMTLVFIDSPHSSTGAKVCETPVGIYEIEPRSGEWRGYYCGMIIHRPTESEIRER